MSKASLQCIWIPVPRLLPTFSYFVFQRFYRTCAKSSLCLVSESRFCLEFGCPCHSYISPLSFFERLQPKDVSLIEMGLFIVLLFHSLSKNDWFMSWVVRLCNQACVFNHTSQAMNLKLNRMLAAKQKTWATFIDATKIPISLCLVIKSYFSDQTSQIIATNTCWHTNRLID